MVEFLEKVLLGAFKARVAIADLSEDGGQVRLLLSALPTFFVL